MGISLNSFCYSCNNEAKKTSLLTYRILQALSDKNEERYLMLEALAKLSSYRSPEIKVAGVFAYNRGVLFTVFNLAVFYIIINLQFIA